MKTIQIIFYKIYSTLYLLMPVTKGILFLFNHWWHVCSPRTALVLLQFYFILYYNFRTNKNIIWFINTAITLSAYCLILYFIFDTLQIKWTGAARLLYTHVQSPKQMYKIFYSQTPLQQNYSIFRRCWQRNYVPMDTIPMKCSLLSSKKGTYILQTIRSSFQ